MGFYLILMLGPYQKVIHPSHLNTLYSLVPPNLPTILIVLNIFYSLLTSTFLYSPSTSRPPPTPYPSHIAPSQEPSLPPSLPHPPSLTTSHLISPSLPASLPASYFIASILPPCLSILLTLSYRWDVRTRSGQRLHGPHDGADRTTRYVTISFFWFVT